MTTAYRVYWNQGTGGPVVESVPMATVAAPPYTTGPLGTSTDNTFVVRAYDTVTGLEQVGNETRVRVLIGADGTDQSGLPNTPHALILSAAAAGGARLNWAYAPADGWGTPTGFNVYLSTGEVTVNESSIPAATVFYTPGRVGYACTLPGPYTTSTYTAAVRSFNKVGPGASLVSVTGNLDLPTPFDMETIQVTAETPQT